MLLHSPFNKGHWGLSSHKKNFLQANRVHMYSIREIRPGAKHKPPSPGAVLSNGLSQTKLRRCFHSADKESFAFLKCTKENWAKNDKDVYDSRVSYIDSNV
jgi:hypothetical protein